MKKICFLMVLLLSICLGFTSCSQCSGGKPQSTTFTEEVGQVNDKAPLVMENAISTNRQDMYLNYGQNYSWFETYVLLSDYLDEDCDGTIAEINSVFQIVTEVGNGYDTNVVLFTNTPDTSTIEVKHAFWVGDFPLNNEQIKITFTEAFDKVMAVNLPKPHSRHVVLRKEVGPKAANPQYIFGNKNAQIYVDATTGEVSDKNPAFGEGFTMPLGEWP